MYIKIEETAELFDLAVAMAVSRQIMAKPDSLIGLATGTTTVGPHSWLVRLARELGVDYSRVKTVNLDEYVGLAADDPKSCRYRIDKQLLNHVNIDKSNTNVPDGLRTPIEDELQVFRDTIDRFGGIDLQILSIGTNGHIAFNEPGTPFGASLYIAKLSDSTLDAKTDFFGGDRNAVPRAGITMGLKDIMHARHVLLIAKGKNKAGIMKETLKGRITENVPASVLQLHPALSVIMDADAATFLR